MWVEYQQAQKSAEHHNKIMWTLIHIGIGSSLIIFYTMLVAKIAVEAKIAILFFGALILFYFNKIIEKSNKTKNYMWDVCQKIEDETPNLRYKIHQGTKKLHSKEKLESLAILRLGNSLLFFVYLISIIYLTFNKLNYLLSINQFDIYLYFVLGEIILFIPFVMVFLISSIIPILKNLKNPLSLFFP